MNKDDRYRESLRCKHIKFWHTGNKSEMHDKDRTGAKIDICGYLVGDGAGKKKRGRCLPGLVQIFVELKLQDFACDNPSPGRRFLYGHINNKETLKHATRALGQQVSYATNIFARQHRNFLFSIFMTPTHARFLRWDRAGVIISESFNYRIHPDILCEFLWRFGYMTDAQRGCDISVSRASPAEEAIFHKAIRKHVESQLGADFATLDKEYARHYEKTKVVKIPVRKTIVAGVGDDAGGSGGSGTRGQNNDAEEVLEYLVSCPVASPASLASRATRGYWAVNSKTEEVGFLKDTWRTNVADMEIEGEILEQLGRKNVRNVPTLLCHSDVGAGDSEGSGMLATSYSASH